MRVFGCTWKINFPEIIFSWPGVLKALAQKWFEVKIFTSNHFRTHAQRERERAFNFNFADLRTHQSTNRSRLRLRRSTNPRTSLRPRAFSLRAFDFAGDPEPSCHELIFNPLIYEPTNRFSTQSLRPMSLRLHRRPRAFAPRTHKPISLSLSLCDFDFLCDFDQPTNPRAFDLWFFCCCCGGVGGGVLVVFLLCGGGFCVVGDGK